MCVYVRQCLHSAASEIDLFFLVGVPGDARDRKRRGRDRDEGRNLDGDRGRERERERKALAKEVFNSIVGAVGHDRALRGYNAAKERRSERQRDRRARRARVDR